MSSNVAETYRGRALPKADTRRYWQYVPPDYLTDRQKQVLVLTATGHRDGEVAAMLGISTFTVRNHLVLAEQRLSAKNRAHLIALAVAQGHIKLGNQ